MKPIPITGLPDGAAVEGQVYEDAEIAYLFDKLVVIRLANGIEVQIWWESWNKTQPFVVRAVEGRVVKETRKTACPWVAVAAADKMARKYHTDDRADALESARKRLDEASDAYDAMWNRGYTYVWLAVMCSVVLIVLAPILEDGDWPIFFVLAIGVACSVAAVWIKHVATKRLDAELHDIGVAFEIVGGEDAGR